ncbi:hypothetical protein ACNUDN_29955 [Mycobacterium sp. smrl_JER01]|uniref:hypothetical protein n=1 Tax=Mycobacterium sp. smrl_JER01 TaxID=3402633 RepID=UPI003AD7AF39
MTTIVEVSTGSRTRTVAELIDAGVQQGCMVFGAGTESQSGSVLGWLVVEPSAASGPERQCAIVSELFGVVATGSVSEVQVGGDSMPADREMPTWAVSLAVASWEARRARAERDAARDALRAHEQRLEKIVDAAHTYADENSLCTVFDDFMVSQGLPAREHEYIHDVDVTLRLRLRTTAHSAEAAANLVDDETVRNELVSLAGRHLTDALQDHDVIDTEDA